MNLGGFPWRHKRHSHITSSAGLYHRAENSAQTGPEPVRKIQTDEDTTMKYGKPQITNTMDAVSNIHQAHWTVHTMNGVAKSGSTTVDAQTPIPSVCTASAYEADE